MTFYYSAFGMTFKSDIICPFLEIPQQDNYDIQIKIGVVPEFFSEKNREHLCEIENNKILFKYFNYGRFLFQENEIIVEHIDASSLIFPTLMAGILLHYKKYYLFHANVVAKNGKAVILLGPSERGKSTLATLLIKRGFQLLTDDVCAIDFQNQIRVMPGIARSKLTMDTITRFNISPSTLVPVGFGIPKFFRNGVNFCNDILPIQQIFYLNKSEKSFSIEIVKHKGFKAITTLLANTYMPALIKSLNRNAEYFEKCALLANNSSIYEILRPTRRFTGFEIADLIEKDVYAI